MSKMGRALVAMSGGVDSSVAAAMLHEEGYEVVGITMKTWSHDGPAAGPSTAPSGKAIGCCTLDAMNDARAVALRYGFAHFIVDIREEFGAAVVEPFARAYLGGETPNPCILCNTHIKWAALLRRADALGCETISTGHYARTGTRTAEDGAERHTIRRGLDAAKDQSYVLWGLPQSHLARSRFPIGGFEKPEIRRLAREWGLDAVAGKPDSYEICFVPEGDYRDFLRRRDPGLDARVGGGAFVLGDGTVVGRHRGHPFYTVGQRRGLEIALGYPAYVTAIDASANTVTIGPREQLLRQTLRARGVNWVARGGLDGDGLGVEVPVTAQIRAHDPGAPALAWAENDGGMTVAFAEPRAMVTPGQAVVVYEGDTVLAGGWIASVDGASTNGAAPGVSVDVQADIPILG